MIRKCSEIDQVHELLLLNLYIDLVCTCIRRHRSNRET